MVSSRRHVPQPGLDRRNRLAQDTSIRREASQSAYPSRVGTGNETDRPPLPRSDIDSLEVIGPEPETGDTAGGVRLKPGHLIGS